MKCPECGAEFGKQRPWQRYDKPECAQRQRNRRRAKRVKKALRQLEAQQTTLQELSNV